MHKHSKRNAIHSDFDLRGDFLKIKDALSDTAKDARGRAVEMLSNSYDNVKEKTTDLQDVVTDYVSEKPLKSLGLAMLCGWLMGAYMTIKRTRRR